MTKNRIFIVFLVLVISAYAFPILASADMGPKPSIEVAVENPPNELYYIELLEEDQGMSYEGRSVNVSNESKFNQEMVDTIVNYNVDGFVWWYGGALEDEIHASTDEHQYLFSYDVPDTFKFIVVTESGKCIVTERITKKAYNARFTLDLSNGVAEEISVKEDLSGYLISALPSYLVTLIGTLIIELLVFKMFSFKLNDGKNVLCLILANVCTQIILYVFLFILPSLGFIIGEIFAFVIESIVYAIFLKPKSRAKSVFYAIAANYASAVIGIPLLTIFYYK
ncbi:MAG: hypothetical protein LUI06_06685 [Ruminococcus sp.]|nr:hypothetical protein [Ruminococcus sp.]